MSTWSSDRNLYGKNISTKSTFIASFPEKVTLIQAALASQNPPHPFPKFFYAKSVGFWFWASAPELGGPHPLDGQEGCTPPQGLAERTAAPPPPEDLGYKDVPSEQRSVVQAFLDRSRTVVMYLYASHWYSGKSMWYYWTSGVPPQWLPALPVGNTSRPSMDRRLVLNWALFRRHVFVYKVSSNYGDYISIHRKHVTVTRRMLISVLLQSDWQDEIPTWLATTLLTHSGDVIHLQLRPLGLGPRLHRPIC